MLICAVRKYQTKHRDTVHCVKIRVYAFGISDLKC